MVDSGREASGQRGLRDLEGALQVGGCLREVLSCPTGVSTGRRPGLQTSRRPPTHSSLFSSPHVSFTAPTPEVLRFLQSTVRGRKGGRKVKQEASKLHPQGHLTLLHSRKRLTKQRARSKYRVIPSKRFCSSGYYSLLFSSYVPGLGNSRRCAEGRAPDLGFFSHSALLRCDLEQVPLVLLALLCSL